MGQLSPTNVMSAGWLTAYQQPVLEAVAYAEIWTALNPISGGSTLLLGNIPVVAGSVTIDRNNLMRRTASNITLLLDHAGLLLPIANTSTGYYAPYGHEIHLYKGCIEPGNVKEYAKLGVFLLEDVDIKDDGNGIVLEGTMSDRGQWVARRGFETPFTMSSYVVGDAINFLMTAAGMNPAVSLTETGSAWAAGATPCPYIPAACTYIIGDDPWKSMCDLAAHAGLQLYFDYLGRLVLDYIPDPTSIAACVTYLEGTSTAPTTLARTVSNKTVPNVVCVTSQGSKVPSAQQVWWWDSNASSPTYYAPAPAGGFSTASPQLYLATQAGTYPRLIQKFDSSIIGPAAQTAQAQAVAIAIGLTSIGSLEKDVFTIRDQPAHDVDDVMIMGRVSAGVPTNTKYVVDKVVIDMGVKVALQIGARLVI